MNNKDNKEVSKHMQENTKIADYDNTSFLKRTITNTSSALKRTFTISSSSIKSFSNVFEFDENIIIRDNNIKVDIFENRKPTKAELENINKNLEFALN